MSKNPYFLKDLILRTYYLANGGTLRLLSILGRLNSFKKGLTRSPYIKALLNRPFWGDFERKNRDNGGVSPFRANVFRRTLPICLAGFSKSWLEGWSMSEGSGQQFEQHSFVHKGRTIDYAIVNLVASGGLNANLDLYNLAMSIPNIEYEPEQFPGAILKMKEPKVSMLLFKNGKIICSGASAQSQIDVAIKKANKMINEIQPSVKILKTIEYEVVNLVATGNLHQNLDLFATAMQLENVEYEPEQFPGAILRMDSPKLTMLLFKNGKVICAGAKNEKEMIRGLETADDLVRGMKSGATPRKKKTMESDDGSEDEDEDEDFDEEEIPATKTPLIAPKKVPVKQLVEEDEEEKEDEEKEDDDAPLDDEEAEDEDEIDLSPIKGKNRKAPVKPVKKKKSADDDDDDADLDDEKEAKDDEEEL